MRGVHLVGPNREAYSAMRIALEIVTVRKRLGEIVGQCLMAQAFDVDCSVAIAVTKQ
jgi:hypothetical protein